VSASVVPALLASTRCGLIKAEARCRLKTVGPNAMPDTAVRPLRAALGKLWAPVPWMLEAAIALEIVLGNYLEGGIIAALLVFNAAIGLFHEGAHGPRSPHSSRASRSSRVPSTSDRVIPRELSGTDAVRRKLLRAGFAPTRESIRRMRCPRLDRSCCKRV
jgi:Cation transporter/ATPase, N-terminus